MANLDDELALFESEIAQIESSTPTEDEPLTKKAKVTYNPRDYSGASISAAPQKGCSLRNTERRPTLAPPPPVVPPVFVPPVIPPMGVPMGVPPLGAPFVPGLASPFIASSLRSNAAAFVQSHMRGPMPPVPPSMQVPMQSPMAPVLAAAPTTYEAPKPQTLTPLPSDIEKMEIKKMTDPLKNRMKGKDKKLYDRSGGGQTWEDASLGEWDENDFRIFCGDLGNEVSDELLAKAFRKYPSFQKAKVVRDGRSNKSKGYGFVSFRDSDVVRDGRSNKSKGYGFVSFRDSDDYVRAIREMDGKYVGNRPIKLRKSNWKDRNLDVIKRKQKQKKDLGLYV